MGNVSEILDHDQLRTAVLLYLKEVRGIPMSRVERVTVPCYSAAGDVQAVCEVTPKGEGDGGQ